jgi:hypothetical protein
LFCFYIDGRFGSSVFFSTSHLISVYCIARLMVFKIGPRYIYHGELHLYELLVRYFLLSITSGLFWSLFEFCFSTYFFLVGCGCLLSSNKLEYATVVSSLHTGIKLFSLEIYLFGPMVSCFSKQCDSICLVSTGRNLDSVFLVIVKPQ